MTETQDAIQPTVVGACAVNASTKDRCLAIHSTCFYNRVNQIHYQPVSKTIADNASVNVVEVIIADCSPDSGVIDFQSSLVRQRTSV